MTYFSLFASGFLIKHVLQFGHRETRDFMTGDLAAADIDRDGWVDLYIPRGDRSTGLLLHNLGNGQFADEAADWNLLVAGRQKGSTIEIAL